MVNFDTGSPGESRSPRPDTRMPRLLPVVALAAACVALAISLLPPLGWAGALVLVAIAFIAGIVARVRAKQPAYSGETLATTSIAIAGLSLLPIIVAASVYFLR